jgi:hypothetical protein
VASRKRDKAQVVNDLAELLMGKLTAGSNFGGTVKVAGLDVEIAVRVKRTLDGGVARDYLAELFDGIETGVIGRWGDCAVYVKERGSWAFSGSTRSCRAPVTHAVVTSSKEPAWRFHFLCRHHAKAEQHAPVIEIPKVRLKAAVDARARRELERERLSKMTDAERIAEDAKMAGRPDEADKIKRGILSDAIAYAAGEVTGG